MTEDEKKECYADPWDRANYMLNIILLDCCRRDEESRNIKDTDALFKCSDERTELLNLKESLFAGDMSTVEYIIKTYGVRARDLEEMIMGEKVLS